MGLRSWYEEAVLPKAITFACGQPEIMQLRRDIMPLATGHVFELGCGGGLNQSLLERDRVASFSGLDPNPALLEKAREQARARGLAADIRAGVGENIPFGDGAFDSVVCSFTLCSVADQARVLAELRRVLRPGGNLLFLEHGKAPDPEPARWQRRIEPVWKRMMGNCHLTRDIGPAIRRAGFDVRPIGQAYMPKTPRWAGWVEWGEARRAGA